MDTIISLTDAARRDLHIYTEMLQHSNFQWRGLDHYLASVEEKYSNSDPVERFKDVSHQALHIDAETLLMRKLETALILPFFVNDQKISMRVHTLNSSIDASCRVLRIYIQERNVRGL